MKAEVYHYANQFLQDTQEWLEEQEAVNNLMLGIAKRAAARPLPADVMPAMISVSDKGELKAACCMTPMRPAVLYASANDEANLRVLSEALLATGRPVAGCSGPKDTAAIFAGLWAQVAGQAATLKEAQRVYELTAVTSQPFVPGRSRQATMDDLPLTTRWVYDFCVDVGQEMLGMKEAHEAAQQAIARGELLLWEDAGQTVSMAAVARPGRRGICISKVYTPPGLRCRGYASACVAALSQRQLDGGWEACWLFTNLANPTSNSIYQKIGYRPMADWSYYVFKKPSSDARPGKDG